jgi:hypothetical protein
MSEIARSDNVQSFQGSEPGEPFQIHVLACCPTVRTMDLKVGKNPQSNVSDFLTTLPL